MSIQEEKKTVHEKIISGCISRWPLPPEVRVMLVTQAAVPLWPPLRSRGLLKGQGRERKKKITAQSIPMWSPTIVLTLPSSV